MARKPQLTPDTLAALGVQRLAQIVIDEAERVPAFRKRVVAALASTAGPDAVAKLIDRRLVALERARAMVGWEKERAFAEDLDATVRVITQELAPLSPIHAVQRLLRFVGGHAQVFERIDDSSGRIQDVYWRAAGAVPEIIAKILPRDLAQIPDLLTTILERDTHGLARQVAVSVAPLLPKPLLSEWDLALSSGARRRRGDQAAETGTPYLEVRQAIADARGDLDGFIMLEAKLPSWRQNPLRVAERLLAGKRLDEALIWVRKERKEGLAFAAAADIADGRIDRVFDLERVRLEAKILDAKGDRTAAQAIRWAAFDATLNVGLLRDYIKKLDDFLEQDELDRAFAVVACSKMIYVALQFFIEWPRLDLAAKLVLDRVDVWDGRYYDVLANAAGELENDHPLAAMVLYRALLNDILGRGKSQAYHHGAGYLAKLDGLASSVATDPRLENHVTYVLGLRKAHGRKSGFWRLVEGDVLRASR